MARTTYEPKVKELAFRIWRETGQNWTDTIRRLSGEYGYTKLKRQTLYDWAQAHDWQDRAARLQSEEERAEISKLLGRERILADLDAQKRRYEDYLNSLDRGKIDNAAVTAYANLLKVMEGMQSKIEAGAGLNKLQLAMDVMRNLSGFVRESYPQHAAAFLEILEPFGDRLVDLYG
jgi:hypothetical protein